MVGEVQKGPGRPLLAGLFHDAEDVEQDGDDEGDPAEDGAVRAVVEGRIYGEHCCVGKSLLAMMNRYNTRDVYSNFCFILLRSFSSRSST